MASSTPLAAALTFSHSQNIWRIISTTMELWSTMCCTYQRYTEFPGTFRFKEKQGFRVCTGSGTRTLHKQIKQTRLTASLSLRSGRNNDTDTTRGTCAEALCRVPLNAQRYTCTTGGRLPTVLMRPPPQAICQTWGGGGGGGAAGGCRGGGGSAAAGGGGVDAKIRILRNLRIGSCRWYGQQPQPPIN